VKRRTRRLTGKRKHFKPLDVTAGLPKRRLVLPLKGRKANKLAAKGVIPHVWFWDEFTGRIKDLGPLWASPDLVSR
jgi:hypothetical protein